MFPRRFWPNRMFAPRYWPKVGAAAVTVVPPFEGRIFVEHFYSGRIDITHPQRGGHDTEHVTAGDIQAP